MSLVPINIPGHLLSKTCDPRPLKGGAALSFDGNGVITNFAQSFFFNSSGNDDYAFSFIIKNDNNTFQSIIGNQSQGFTDRYGTGACIKNGNLIIFFNRNNDGYKYFYPLNGNSWYNVVVKVTNMPLIGTSSLDFNIGSVKVWVDGVLVDNNQNAKLFNYNYRAGLFGARALDNMATPNYKGSCFGLGYWDSVIPSDEECLNLSQNYEIPDNSYFYYKLDESIGINTFDSSGNGYNGEIQGTYTRIDNLETYSYRDNLGYSDGEGVYLGVEIPRDEQNIEFDILGNELQYKGRACGANSYEIIE